MLLEHFSAIELLMLLEHCSGSGVLVVMDAKLSSSSTLLEGMAQVSFDGEPGASSRKRELEQKIQAILAEWSDAYMQVHALFWSLLWSLWCSCICCN